MANIALIGASGFVGRHVCYQLAKDGHTIHALQRYPHKAIHLKISAYPSNIHLHSFDMKNAEAYLSLFKGIDTVINCTGQLFETKTQSFQNLHVEGLQKLLSILKNQSPSPYFIHFSAIGADKNSPSVYARTKGQAEEIIQQSNLPHTIIRPSLVAGPEDKFFNRFAQLLPFIVVMPLFYEGRTKFQLVYIKDIAHGVSKLVSMHEQRQEVPPIIQAVGPDVWTYKELMSLIMKLTNRPKPFLSLPLVMGKSMGFVMEYLLSNPLLTRDQLLLLKYDNVASEKDLTFEKFGLCPVGIEPVLQKQLNGMRKE
jgi:NADH dehydrogenase